jgi:DNA-binding NarL/FixJ family response regulator
VSFLPSEPPAALGGSVQVLVFERHAASRIGYGLLLRRQPWIASCLLADERDDAVAIARRTKPDVALIDISDVGPFVAAHIAPLREAHPGMAVVLSTRDCGPQRAPLGAFAGAPLLTAESSSEEVVQAVRSALIEDTSTTAAASAVSATGGALLSEREREVLALLCTGATNREIAAAMHVSAETVKKHAATLYRKLGVRNRTEAAQRAPELLTA